MNELMEKIEAYGFECEAGTLANCKEWKQLKRVAQETADGLDQVQKTLNEVLEA